MHTDMHTDVPSAVRKIGIDVSVVKVHTKCSMKECIEVKKSHQGYFKMGHC
jgi:hypothetical protein